MASSFPSELVVMCSLPRKVLPVIGTFSGFVSFVVGPAGRKI